MNNTESKVRNETLDVVKGFLILFVILGHALVYCCNGNSWSNPVFVFLYSFHMPLFIMLSGYFFTSSLRKNFTEVLINKSKRLLLPLFLWSLVLAMIYFIGGKFTLFIHNGDCAGIIKELFKITTKFWYLVCVYILSFIYYLFFKNGKIIKITLIIIYLLSIFNLLRPIIPENYQVTRMALAFGFGSCISYYKQTIAKFQNKKLLYSVLIITSLLFVCFNRICFGYRIDEYPLWSRVLDGFFCSIPMFLILNKLSTFVLKSKMLRSLLIYCGINSLSLYVVHVIFSVSFRLFRPFELNTSFISVLLLFLVYFIGSVIITEILRAIFKKKSYIFGI